ncbi:hypothetical protein ATANTOWER_032896 [Ataeniobius toweri]|uniref:DUF4371 domain-containing protein n=1 Tax=Ataeniobius toweri TaxID=208326 RepID=A0ABU7AD78_9TELE|nr:hypothetical protein [Ataeniobius toweri]
MLEILAWVVDLPTLEAIRLSTPIGLEVDESTDMSLTRKLDIHISTWTERANYSVCQFLDMVPLNDGKADTIAEAIREVITINTIPTDRIFGLGTDGGAVMTVDSLKITEVKDTKWLSQDTAISTL